MTNQRSGNETRVKKIARIASPHPQKDYAWSSPEAQCAGVTVEVSGKASLASEPAFATALKRCSRAGRLALGAVAEIQEKTPKAVASQHREVIQPVSGAVCIEKALPPRFSKK